MNTPRSKPPKRHTGVAHAPPRPDGRYESGVWNERHAMLIGQIATYWVLVEDEMIEILRDLLGGDKRLPARQIFRSIVSNEARRKLLIALLEKAPINRNKDRFYDDVIAQFYSLNGRRNDYVHGLWQTFEDGETVYLCTESIEDFHFFEGRKVPVTELEATMRDMGSLMNKLMDRREARESREP